jgi:predicted metal-binding membrane protein
MHHLFRSALWLGFFFLILLSWWVIYSMSLNMDLDLMGRPGKMGVQMAAMDPKMPMHMPMANFGPLFLMWAIMMAAMMLPTMVPTLRSYEDLIISATGTRIGWIGVTLGYLVVWVSFTHNQYFAVRRFVATYNRVAWLIYHGFGPFQSMAHISADLPLKSQIRP